MAGEPFRLCVDLNVWVSNFLALAKTRRGTAAQTIVEAIQDGRSGIGPIQLVISHTMLTRLTIVLTRMGASEDSATQFAQLIGNISLLGPQQEFPHVVLGGGVLPSKDAKMAIYDPYDPASRPPFYDPEDGRVLDTAIAGRADALVTANFRDFVDLHDTIISRGRVHVRRTANHDLYIVQPQEMASWLRSGRRPVPEEIRTKDITDSNIAQDIAEIAGKQHIDVAGTRRRGERVAGSERLGLAKAIVKRAVARELLPSVDGILINDLAATASEHTLFQMLDAVDEADDFAGMLKFHGVSVPGHNL